MARFFTILACLISLSGCMTREDDGREQFAESGTGLFVVCEGNFQYGNSTLSYYDPATRRVENEVFRRANDMRLGDVAQSMTLYGDRAWIVVNNSHVAFAIDETTFCETGRIEGLASPRFIHFVSPRKAYVSQLWDNRIIIVDPLALSVTGTIEIPGMSATSGSTEQMVDAGGGVIAACWSYQDRLVKIDPATDLVVAQVRVGLQPRSMAVDCRGKVWVLTDGGYAGSPVGSEAPSLVRVDPESMTVERRWTMDPEATVASLCIDGAGRTLYWAAGDVWRMDIDSEYLPAAPFVAGRGTRYYQLTVDPSPGGDLYVADAIDYQQPGIIYRFTTDGGYPVDQFYVGVNPGAFCWK